MKRLELYLPAQSPRYDDDRESFNFMTKYYCTADDRPSILPIGLQPFPEKTTNFYFPL